MRILAVLVLLLIVFGCGCSSAPHSFAKPSHFSRHLTVFYQDLHNLHVDLDRVLFDIYEYDESMKVRAD